MHNICAIISIDLIQVAVAQFPVESAFGAIAPDM